MGPKAFKVKNCWYDYKEFKDFVLKEWNSFDIHGRKAFILKEKFKLSRNSL